MIIPKLHYNQNRAKWHFRLLTWRFRTLPGVIIIGAQKSGTTSLFHYLSQHPSLFPGTGKKVHYFDGGLKSTDTYQLGEKWYRAHFPLKMAIQSGIAFEASPLYLYHPVVPERIHMLVPDVKLICVLRDPTQRAISHYYHERRIGRETLPILHAINVNEPRIDIPGSNNFNKANFIQYSYVSRGRYAEQLERYYQLFDPSKIYILNSESLFSNPQNALAKLFKFIGINSNYIVRNLTAKNVYYQRKAVPESLIKMLNEYYAPYNESLFNLIGNNFNWGE